MMSEENDDNVSTNAAGGDDDADAADSEQKASSKRRRRTAEEHDDGEYHPEMPTAAAAPLYMRSLLTRTIYLPMYRVDGNLPYTLVTALKAMVENKCVHEGFVKPNSVSIFSYSPGTVKSSEDVVQFDVSFYADVCYPLHGAQVDCVVKSVTKAGIHAHVYDAESDTYPITVFIVREHHRQVIAATATAAAAAAAPNDFAGMKPRDTFRASIVGVRFELNDHCIYAIGKLLINE